jgi:hypothetical protein
MKYFDIKRMMRRSKRKIRECVARKSKKGKEESLIISNVLPHQEERQWSKTFYKVMKVDDLHHGMKYVPGENIFQPCKNVPEFNLDETVTNGPGGLYFADLENMRYFLSGGVSVREVTLPFQAKGFKVVDLGKAYRANMIILGRKFSLFDKDVYTWMGGKKEGYQDFINRALHEMVLLHGKKLNDPLCKMLLDNGAELEKISTYICQINQRVGCCSRCRNYGS